jgi:hypothetical protein
LKAAGAKYCGTTKWWWCNATQAEAIKALELSGVRVNPKWGDKSGYTRYQQAVVDTLATKLEAILKVLEAEVYGELVLTYTCLDGWGGGRTAYTGPNYTPKDVFVNCEATLGKDLYAAIKVPDEEKHMEHPSYVGDPDSDRFENGIDAYGLNSDYEVLGNRPGYCEYLGLFIERDAFDRIVASFDPSINSWDEHLEREMKEPIRMFEFQLSAQDGVPETYPGLYKLD